MPHAVAAGGGDANGDGFDALAVRAPGEGVGRAAGAGAVNLFEASGGRVLAPGPAFTQGSGGRGGAAEAGGAGAR